MIPLDGAVDFHLLIPPLYSEGRFTGGNLRAGFSVTLLTMMMMMLMMVSPLPPLES